MTNFFQILVTPEVSCELTRVCLRQHDDELDDESESGSNSDAVDTGLSDSVSYFLTISYIIVYLTFS